MYDSSDLSHAQPDATQERPIHPAEMFTAVLQLTEGLEDLTLVSSNFLIRKYSGFKTWMIKVRKQQEISDEEDCFYLYFFSCFCVLLPSSST